MPLTPLPATQQPWPVSVQNAYQQLHQIYQTTSSYVASESLEAHCLQQYGQAIIGDTYSLLLLMEASSDEGSPLKAWIEAAANEFTEVLTIVNDRWASAQQESPANITMPQLIYSEHNKKRGCPRKCVDPKILHDAFQKERQIPVTVLASILGINRKTLKLRMKELDINSEYSTISNDDLDNLVREYRQENPTGGRSYVIGHLRAVASLKIQCQRVIDSMDCLDRLGQGMRQRAWQKKERKVYQVPRPNALWHIDGHHKLISWGIVIHGVANGYSRTVTGLRASTNNRAETVLDMFIDAILKYGMPFRLRGDREGENRDVSILMILLRGANRASFMWRSSVFNTRIERLWVEVGRRFVRQWHAFFTRLERCHLLERKNPYHCWLLHFLFLDLINEDCQKFSEEWNAHPISGAGLGYSPNDMVFLGELKHGVYDDCLDLTEDEINAFYGFDQNGESLDAEEEDPSDDEVANTMLEEETQEASSAEDFSDVNEEESERAGISEENSFDTKVVDENIRHKAVPVPSSACPFDKDQLSLFEKGMEMLINSDDLPDDYGVTAAELGVNGFDEQEEISIGLRMKGYAIELPYQTWKPRAEMWAKGLYAMNAILCS